MHKNLTHPKYRPDIDGLRAAAVLAVVGFHAFPGWIHGGFIGVDIFFVISGYLISTIIMGSLEKNSFSFLEFYLRRINRIFPALLLVLICSLVFGWFILLPEEYKQLGKHIAGGASFISNYMFWGRVATLIILLIPSLYCTYGHLEWRSSSTLSGHCSYGLHGKKGSTFL